MVRGKKRGGRCPRSPKTKMVRGKTTSLKNKPRKNHDLSSDSILLFFPNFLSDPFYQNRRKTKVKQEMGIQDLLRFLKPFVEYIHIQKYAGKRVRKQKQNKKSITPFPCICMILTVCITIFFLMLWQVGIDAYSWLHKGGENHLFQSDPKPPFFLFCVLCFDFFNGEFKDPEMCFCSLFL